MFDILYIIDIFFPSISFNMFYSTIMFTIDYIYLYNIIVLFLFSCYIYFQYIINDYFSNHRTFISALQEGWKTYWLIFKYLGLPISGPNTYLSNHKHYGNFNEINNSETNTGDNTETGIRQTLKMSVFATSFTN